MCSDIHGMRGSYEDALKKLNEDDILYVLGDATDRGDEGIEIILDILSRAEDTEKKQKVEYIIGNHDLLLIENMETIMKHDIRIRSQSDMDLWETFENLCIELEYEKLLKEKFNPDNLFKNRTKAVEDSNVEKLSMIEYKEKNFLQKIFDKIKRLFN